MPKVTQVGGGDMGAQSQVFPEAALLPSSGLVTHVEAAEQFQPYEIWNTSRHLK